MATNYKRKAARLVRQSEKHFQRALDLMAQASQERKVGRALIRAAELACPSATALTAELARQDRRAAAYRDEPAIPDYCGHLEIVPGDGLGMACTLDAGHLGPHQAMDGRGRLIREWNSSTAAPVDAE